MQHNRQKVSESPSCATTQSRRPYANERAWTEGISTDTDVQLRTTYYVTMAGKNCLLLFNIENICELIL